MHVCQFYLMSYEWCRAYTGHLWTCPRIWRSIPEYAGALSLAFESSFQNLKLTINYDCDDELDERIVRARLKDYLSSDSLLNPINLASQNTTQLKLSFPLSTCTINWPLPSAISYFCLLDISAAFDTVDHGLLQRLSSWFGISYTALLLFQSYTCLSVPSLLNPPTLALNPSLHSVVFVFSQSMRTSIVLGTLLVLSRLWPSNAACHKTR